MTSQTPKIIERAPRWAKFFVLILTLWMGFATWRGWKTWYLIHAFGTSAQGHVTRRYQCGWAGDISAYCVDYEFETVGPTKQPQQYSGQSSIRQADFERFAPGAPINVRYVHQDPRISEVSPSSPFAFRIFGPLLGTLMGAILCVMLFEVYRGKGQQL
jgi:hypothetical protein